MSRLVKLYLLREDGPEGRGQLLREVLIGDQYTLHFYISLKICLVLEAVELPVLAEDDVRAALVAAEQAVSEAAVGEIAAAVERAALAAALDFPGELQLVDEQGRFTH